MKSYLIWNIAVLAAFFGPLTAVGLCAARTAVFDEHSTLYDYSSRLGVRTSFGALVAGHNTTGISYRGIEPYFVHFLSSKMALGLGYLADPPFSGFDLFGRYYFVGQGTRSLTVSESMSIQRRDAWGIYSGASAVQRSYSYNQRYVSGASPTGTPNVAETTLSGTNAYLCVLFGLDRKVFSNLDANVEVSYGFASLYSSDPAVVIKGYSASIGMSYLW